jgi:membrane-associated protein
MHYRTFVVYNFVGALLWAVGVTLAGYYLGQIDVVKDNIEIALVAIVLVSVLPMLIEVWRHRRKRSREVPDDAPIADEITAG